MTRTPEEIDKKLTGSCADLAATYELCGSPIEKILLYHLTGGRVAPSRVHLEGGHPQAWFSVALGLWGVFVVSQYDFEPYRFDIAVLWDGKVFIDIECDGHDFHDRTREQASKDRKRDREVQRAGWRVMRFTGSDIVRDPRAVANEIRETVDAEVRKALGLA